jgi:hypothetical protein
MESQTAAVPTESLQPGLIREMSGARADVGGSIRGASESTGTSAAPGAQETFAALDSASASKATTWMHAGAQRAEAGFQDPALGWVSVRADAGSGGIHASLVPSSADAAQALGGHLAGLSAHLVEHHTPVETLTLAAPEGRGLDTGMERNGNQNMQQGSGQGAQAGQEFGTGAELTGVAPAIHPAVRVTGGGLEAALAETRPGGGHISVMA